MFYEADDSNIYNHWQLVVYWGQQFKIYKPLASTPAAAFPSSVPCTVTADPVYKTEISRKVQTVGRHKTWDSGGLISVLFKNTGTDH